MPVTSLDLLAMAPDQAAATAALLGRAFVADPLHEKTFGPGRVDLNEGFFRVGLAAMKGTKMLAVENGRTVGMAHWVTSPACQHSIPEQAVILPRMIGAVGVRPSLRIVGWLSAWGKQDPKEPHSHLGPIAVEPDAWGRGIGSRLMERYCEEMDRTGLAGFLETDRPRNVKLYERFGFRITATTRILGIENWFMRREGAR